MYHSPNVSRTICMELTFLKIRLMFLMMLMVAKHDLNIMKLSVSIQLFSPLLYEMQFEQ